MKARRRRSIQRHARERGYRIAAVNRSHSRVMLECLVCGAWRSCHPFTVRNLKRCTHPHVDVETRYEYDLFAHSVVAAGPQSTIAVAAVLGVTKQRVCQIETAALAKLRQAFVDAGWSEEDVRAWLYAIQQRDHHSIEDESVDDGYDSTLRREDKLKSYRARHRARKRRRKT